MPRRAKIKKRIPAPDAVYRSEVLSKFINCMMMRGKKTVAENIVYKALSRAEEKLNKPGIEVFEQALSNIRPMIEVKPRRVGGATYQVPIEVSLERGTALALRWLIKHARARNGKSMIDQLSAEIMDAHNNTGASVKKREDTHKMADANRAFAHYRY
ncbi:30S ribosomal protein S7 [bacterium (Candidatus Blackallbacteria) CG17_big_fil_post_rev_8_21_14_2_50_48_46]|uniref:Small ribosomal subunit protein uS7 n=1 Tax=bacterium (Candidatus Blackallbacteria) CG17_big_fil_post_rev_8_21_14_2_50_48_46 TaxID=2014261 RepID=A0A2M7G126_9BACT|nr:MAG: 30S ribosomal protein S7 [bacterium (Candidatus Blackallbacteria) CG18_big_fil_WC_8_21_14_2_50_49_26]PIW15389.1 MAG: 30S ribosomal protein S7 [bacterium (Candidatus Blackallbacteria) CG17_big_fil_post_rev_8_21_14_2_50_48_46]PIW49750.1 MAG: 30S ribosomal protein S7 [bacterium (Candidatus Blackallbacteria) CG13_big_fil_rev_8_21_14_2_50_49_14]